MCTQQTTKLCDNLQAIAIATTVDPTFNEWMKELMQSLRNPVAVAHRSNRMLYACYKQGLMASLVAAQLDRTFEVTQPRLFVASK